MFKKALVFDIWGDYAYFRKGFTATSTLTYPFPSRTTISGLIAAILGYQKDSYYDLFDKDKSKISIRILNPLKKTRLNLNYINTKEGYILSDIKSAGKRVQVPAEFLKDVKYRIYVSLDDNEIMDDLFELLNNHKSIYTPYLGISECLANFKLVEDDFLNIENKSNENVNIHSVVLQNNKIIIEKGKKYGIIKSPGFMDESRKVDYYLKYYYEENGKPIKIANADYSKIGDDNVILY